MIELQLKRTKKGTPVVCGPFSIMRAGMEVQISDGTTKQVVRIQSLGKPFRAQGSLMVYGYISGPPGPKHISETLRDYQERIKP